MWPTFVVAGVRKRAGEFKLRKSRRCKSVEERSNVCKGRPRERKGLEMVEPNIASRDVHHIHLRSRIRLIHQIVNVSKRDMQRAVYQERERRENQRGVVIRE